MAPNTTNSIPHVRKITRKSPKARYQGNVICVDKIPERYKNNVLLKLKASSTCEETKVRIQSVLEHLCGEDCKLEIYQKDDTDEIIVYGDSIEADPEGMAGKFNNDNITDKVEVEEAISYMGQRSKIVLISLLITGLLLAALLIAGYLLKINREQSKGLRLAEDSFQVDQENQGNTLLSVAPLPQQEPLDKPIINGESPESPPTNGHSATQTQVADTPM
ncbi:hematopoietic progenitor cell antigen CD34 [Labeo rohita]|uniref:Hematopoietic progenitor cell antigen CD34 n=1 Tax=Labeo rohita TaxID=84645 RepID=A0A498LL90_LABRO|nr:hematopoietic progenitor cell antigen CD34 [Labeo rohita]